MNEKFKLYDKIRIFNDDPDIYHKQTKLKTVFYMGQIVRGRIENSFANQYFTIESLADNNTVTFSNNSSNYSPHNTFYYSLDGTNWTQRTDTTSWTLNNGEKLMLKATANYWYHISAWPDNTARWWRFSSSDKYKVYGNIMSLVHGDNFMGQTTFTSDNENVFCGLFWHSENLFDASNLIMPATTLSNRCYYNMFNECKSLTTVPELPATTLANSCYASMFLGCTALTAAPELPATTLANYCYIYMFQFCTSLTTAPELPATTLAIGCYTSMFSGCSSLNYIKCLATNISASGCIDYWVQNVAASGTFVKAAYMYNWQTATSNNYYAGIPSGWTVTV